MPINCTVPLPVTGTFEHFEHALLASFSFWGNGTSWDLPPSQMNKRMLDPSLSHLVNSTLSDKSVWEHQWLAAAHIRAHKKVPECGG